MDKLKAIDETISSQLKELKNIADESKFQNVCEFSLNEKELGNIPFEALANLSGIYMFEIKKSENISFKEWIDEFKPIFRGKNKEFLHKFTPNIVEKRVSVHSKQDNNNNWIPFYLGKARNIGSRIKTHLYSELGRPPFGLKLMDRGNLNDLCFRVLTLELNVVNYDVIAPIFEKYLRDRYNPIVGK